MWLLPKKTYTMPHIGDKVWLRGATRADLVSLDRFRFGPIPILPDPSMHIILILRPKAYSYDPLWAIWIPRA